MQVAGVEAHLEIVRLLAHTDPAFGNLHRLRELTHELLEPVPKCQATLFRGLAA